MVLRVNDRIVNREVKFFHDFTLSRHYDAISSSFEFSFFFDPTNASHKEFSVPGHIHLCTLHDDDGKLLLTGYILNNHFSSASTPRLTSFGGYSKSGVLSDCEIIPSLSEPLQSDNMNLKDIATKFCTPFGIGISIDPAVASLMLEPYDQTTAKEGQKVGSYLAELASQKNIVLSHNAAGNLLFTRGNRNKIPKYNFDKGMPGVEMTLGFNANGMHSTIKCVSEADIIEGQQSSEGVVVNPYIPFVYRPHIVKQTAGTSKDTDRSARNILSAELKNFSLRIELDRVKVNGVSFDPGDIITVKNDEVYLYEKSKWIIASVETKQDTVRDSTILSCCPPEVFTDDKDVVYIYKGYNLR